MEYKGLALNLAQQAGVTIKQNFQVYLIKRWKAGGRPLTVIDAAIYKQLVKMAVSYFNVYE